MSSIYTQTDADFVAWATNFSALITATPVPYGLTAAQATAYVAPLGAFTAAVRMATDPITRTKATILQKDALRAQLETITRTYVAIINSTPTVTDAQKANLGIPIRKTPARRPAPTVAPDLDVIDREGTQVTIRLHDGSSGTIKRAKPAGVTGATVLSFVGAEPPADPSAWTFVGNVTKTTTTVDFPATLAPGTQVWLTAFWYNPRGSGPGAAPIGTVIAGGAVTRRAA